MDLFRGIWKESMRQVDAHFGVLSKDDSFVSPGISKDLPNLSREQATFERFITALYVRQVLICMMK